MSVAFLYQEKNDGLLLSVKAKPATSKDRALRVVDVGNGAQAFEVSVNASAQEGKANKALCERLAALFGVAKSKVTLVGGAKARHKLFHIEGDSKVLLAQLGDVIRHSTS